ncbi:MAG: arylsulfatase [Cyclobacteriaceae bacterium]|nr:arylsulfatase [Cyclobacteriaceae bacterium HetDA_MAG_MS6]
MLRGFIAFSLAVMMIFMLSTCQDVKHPKPNIVILYADDLGFGDVGCYGAKGVKTPNIDYLAENGLKFTDAHSAAATCTPSRYSLLTGQYAFRNQAQVLPGDAPLIIPPGTSTLPSLLQQAGYSTGVVGKWHLGLGTGQVDWNADIKPGPLEIGFDYAFLLPSTGDRVPSVYLENHKIVGIEHHDPLSIQFTDDPSNNPFERPTGISHPHLLKQKADTQHSGSIINGLSRIGFMQGGQNAEIKDEDMADVFLQRALSFIENTEDSPFFLFFPFHDIHVPRAPHERFQGLSEMGPRGDAIAQMDWVVGQLLEKIKSTGHEEHTLIIFTSDNGAVLDDGYQDGAVEKLGDHQPNGFLRGGKYSAYEGGTRVPTIAYWPTVIQPGSSHAMWSQVDIYRSIAGLLNLKTPPLLDSKDLSQVLLGTSDQGRIHMLEESYTFSLRSENWKYIAPSSKDYSWVGNAKGIESGIKPIPQLFDLEQDPNERDNLAHRYPEKLEEMKQTLSEIAKNP